MIDKIPISHFLCIGLYILCGICFLCNIIGLIRMFIVDKKIRFEKYVLLSGIIEISMILLFIFKVHKEVILDIVQALQILITLYISKQFLALYINIEYSIKNKNKENQKDEDLDKIHGKHIYNGYFWVLAVISITLLVASFITDITEVITYIEINRTLDNIIDILNDFVGMIISIILFIFSIMVRKLMTIKSNEINNKKKEDDGDNEIYSNNEKYLSTRKLQILIIALGNLVTDCIELIISIFKEIIYNKEAIDSQEKNTLNILDVFTLYSLWASTFLNFISFFFIVRDSFHINYKHIKKDKSSYVLTSTLIEKNKEKSNELENFLSEENDNKQRKEIPDEENDFN